MEEVLNERKQKILKAIIKTYMETGEPVGSRTISKYADLNVSSATIRNEMSDQTAKWYDLKFGCCSAAVFPTGWPAAGLCRFLCVSAVFYSATGCCFLCCWPERLILTVFAATTILSCS